MKGSVFCTSFCYAKDFNIDYYYILCIWGVRVSRILSVTNDDGLIDVINNGFCDGAIKLYFANSFEEASNIIRENDIVVIIVDCTMPEAEVKSICDCVNNTNRDAGIFLVFDQSDTKYALDLYNSFNVSGLLCRGFNDLKSLPNMINSCITDYYKFRNSDDISIDYKKLNDVFLKPMQEMSSILNERLSGYRNIIAVFRKSFDFVINTSDNALNAIDVFVDRVINDYINIYMVREPDLEAHFNRINKNYNKSQEKKYFKLINEVNDLKGDAKYNLLFVLDILTVCFDVFYPHYRGKISISNTAGYVEVNAVYEVRKNTDFDNVYTFIMGALNNVITNYSNGVKNAVKDNIIQYRIAFN